MFTHTCACILKMHRYLNMQYTIYMHMHRYMYKIRCSKSIHFCVLILFNFTFCGTLGLALQAWIDASARLSPLEERYRYVCHTWL